MRISVRGLLPAALLACASESTPKTFNDSPTALIVSHSDGATVLEGYPVEFRAQVSDSNHNANELEAAWYIGSTPVSYTHLTLPTICSV